MVIEELWEQCQTCVQNNATVGTDDPAQNRYAFHSFVLCGHTKCKKSPPACSQPQHLTTIAPARVPFPHPPPRFCQRKQHDRCIFFLKKR